MASHWGDGWICGIAGWGSSGGAIILLSMSVCNESWGGDGITKRHIE